MSGIFVSVKNAIANAVTDLKALYAASSGSSLVGFGIGRTVADLITSIGSLLVGHLPSGVGAVDTTVQQQLRNIQGWMINVQDAPYYAVGNGSTDDYAAIQAAIDAAPSGATINLPGKNYLITQRLSIPLGSGITLQGSTQYSTSILCVGCSGIIVNATSGFQIKNLEIAASVRHTTTPNAYIGIEVTGSTGTRPSNHVYRDVLVDGFETSFKSAWLWSSIFDNFRANACKRGIWAQNLSVNNVVSNCAFTTASVASSVGISLDGSVDPSEGWMISNTLIDSFAQGISGDAVTHVYVSNCIIDHCLNYGISITSSGANFGGNWTIRGNYIAMSGASGDSAISSLNAASSSQNRGNIITDNTLLAYAGSTALRGIYMSGTQAIKDVICGNTVSNFSTQDIRTNYGPSIVTDNNCQSAIATNLLISGSSVVKNNIGVLNFAEFAQYETLGQNKVTWSYAIPTTGTWTQGDICYKSNAAASGFIGWVCVTGGTPGTWKTFGAISA